MANTYTIRITLDGSDVKSEAGKVRQIVETELAKIQVSGVIDVAGLDMLTVKMKEVRKDAGGLGRAMAEGMAGQFERAQQELAKIQSQITGIVRTGGAMEMLGLEAGGVDEYTQALSKMETRQITAAQNAKQLESKLKGLNDEIGRLGATAVQPLSGGPTSTLQRLFSGIAEGSKGSITRVRNAIEKELDAMTVVINGRTVNLRAEIERRVATTKENAVKVLEGAPENEIAALQRYFDTLGAGVQVSSQGLLADLDDVNAAIKSHVAIEPSDFSDERPQWEAYYNQLLGIQRDVQSEITQMRAMKLGGDTDELMNILDMRRRELEKEKAEHLEFWREWSMDTPRAITDALRAEGQSAAAGTLERMLRLKADIDKLEAQQKTQLAKLSTGGMAELPKDAKGTLVDFVTAERALGEVAGQATTQLVAQQKVLKTIVAAFDTARLAAEGLNEAQRAAVQQAEKAAAREIKKSTPARLGLEETAEVERQVLSRMAQEVATLTQRIETTLAEPVTEEAEKQATGLLRLWQWVSDKLVGHSIIPEMVTAINDWLSLVGQDAAQQDAAQISAAEQKARVLIDLAEKEAEAGIQAEKRLTAETVAQAKARQTQKTEAARRVTVRQRGATTLDVATGRADIKEQERQNKLLGEAQKLAAEIGLAWEDIAAQMTTSGQTLETVIGGLKRAKQEQAETNRASAQQNRLQAEAQQIAQRMGISWQQVETAMQSSGAEMGDVVRELKRAESEQQRLTADAREIAENYRGLGGAVRLFTRELETARRDSQGLYAITNDLQQIGNSIKMNAGILTGAITVAGRDYITFAKQSDVAARSLSLTADLTQELRRLTIEQSGALAVLDPEQTARGVTIWAQATGQAVENEAELNALLRQTVPIQQAAALSQTDVATLTDATAGALNQYGLALEDTTRVVAIFNKVADDTLASVGDVAESFKYVGPTADRLNISIEETAAMLSILGDNGVRGTMAGTSLGRMMENLLIPNSEDAKETLTDLFGSESPFFDAQGQFVGMARALDMLAAATETMTDQQREAALATLFDVNGVRALTPLLREQTKARQEGQNVLARETQGLSDTALTTWEQQVADWEQSDVYRVQQAQMRWKELWLTIGQQGLAAALPYLEKGARLITDLIATLQANPWLTEIVTQVATGALAIGTVVTAVGTVGKIALSLQTVLTAFKSTVFKQESASALFKTSVISSAEQFRLIITQAATQAAGIENAGATTETATEIGGAQVEAGVEIAAAQTRAALSLATAGRAAGVFVAQIAAGASTFISGLGAALLSAGGALAAALGVIVGGALYEGLRGLGLIKGPALNEVATVIAYKIGEVVGGEERGLEWARVVGEFTGALDENTAAQGQATADLAAYLPVVMRGDAGADTVSGWMDAGVLNRMRGSIDDTTGEIENYNYQMREQGSTVKGLAALTADQKDTIIGIYADMLQAQAEAVTEFESAIAEAQRDMQRDLADLAQDYQKNRADEEASFYADAAQASADYHQQEAAALARHQKDMQRRREDHEARVFDLELSRDAAGLYKENQQYDRERQRAEQDFADERTAAAQEQATEQAKRAAQHAQKMTELATQYEQERAQRLNDHAARVVELTTERDAEMARLKQEHFDKLNAESGYYQQSQLQQQLYQNAMLADAQNFLAVNQRLWTNYVAALPTPAQLDSAGAWAQYQQGQPHYQEGGYVRATGPALVHAGEFVMSAQTARQVEGALGGRLTQQNVAPGRGGVTVHANFTGMGPQDRGWFESRLNDFSRELAEMLQ